MGHDQLIFSQGRLDGLCYTFGSVASKALLILPPEISFEVSELGFLNVEAKKKIGSFSQVNLYFKVNKKFAARCLQNI